jgi:hypothetical protein
MKVLDWITSDPPGLVLPGIVLLSCIVWGVIWLLTEK